MISQIYAYTERFREFNKNIKWFFIGNILFQIGLGVFSVIYNLYIQEIGHVASVNGSIISITSIATAIALVPAGILSDRLGRKPLFLWGGIVASASLGIRAIVIEEHSLLLFAFITGFFTAFIQVTAIPFLAENSSPKQRIHLFSLNFALTMVAQVIGNLGGGVISDLFHYGWGFSGLMSVRISLLVGCFFSLLGFIPLSFIKENKPTVDLPQTKESSFKLLLSTHRSQARLIFRFTLANLIIGIGSGLVIPYLNLYFSDRFSASHSSIGFIVSLGQAATAVAMMIGPWLVSRWGQVKTVVILQLASIPFLLITGFTNLFWLACVGFLIRQALMNAANPITSTMLMEQVDHRFKGLANSFGQMVFMVGWAVTGPFSTSMVATHGTYWGYAINFALTSICYIVGASYFYFVFRKLKTSQKLDQTDSIAS
ncbi:MFS transporter [Hazenella coriacea]|uniref:MFS transporter n=1 Tax=Hazenella coriacea TaxID=1179467 RepID=UPI001FB3E38C|nr:MFS transporter [Hazenella coriacea]